MDKQLPDEKGQLLEMYDAASFSRDAIARFPSLNEELRDSENQLHLQMDVLAAWARSIRLTTPSWAEMSLSKSCPNSSHAILSG
jgi:hypothetical protein